ncbi:hypothetical protein [Aristophania vespae]|uniref:hypothetical protein n=1 Tax=Aristophania vespae TaxID=2697033 RepID=UPI002351B5FA|nr:hypothetical protein [Aristophania vespae]UMM64128.1 hypothetical protein DM15PD_11190 [Aristophania vespae]
MIMRSVLSSHSSFWRLLCCVGGFSLLAGCASNHPPETFASPDYSYLPKMNLSVSKLEIIDQAAPLHDSLAAKSPTSPNESLTLMAQQRLHPTGSTGRGVFTIVKADITEPTDNVLAGKLVVHLTLDDPTRSSHGDVTAQVTHQDNVSEKNSKRHNLYELNRHLMDDMNVELEYQIRKNLGYWLTDATGTPLNGAIATQNLDTIDNTTSVPANGTSNTALQPVQTPTALQDLQNPISNGQTTPAPSVNAPTPIAQPHSPPPGTLQLP